VVDGTLISPFATLKEAFDASNWYDGFFIDASCCSVHKLLEDIRVSFTKMWTTGGLWAITWSNARVLSNSLTSQWTLSTIRTSAG
jgi:hypothetical protein